MMIEKLLTVFGANNDLRLQPQPSLAITASAIEQKQDLITINFLSLCGAQANLPLYISLWCLQNNTLYCLVCIFNQAFYRLYFKLLLPFHPLLCRQRFNALLCQSLGLPMAAQSGLRLRSENLTFASAASFHRLLQQLYGKYYQLEENQLCWHAINNPAQLGGRAQLGEVTLGQRLCSHQYLMRLSIFHADCQWRLLFKLCHYLLASMHVEIVHHRHVVALLQAKLGTTRLVSPRRQVLK